MSRTAMETSAMRGMGMETLTEVAKVGRNLLVYGVGHVRVGGDPRQWL
jgi:hypothetical protein